MLKSSPFIYPFVHSIVYRAEHILELINVSILPTPVVFSIEGVCDVKPRHRHILKSDGFIIATLNFVLVFVIKPIVKRNV